MADSILEQIMKKLVIVLQSITAANGYANTILNVERQSASGPSLARMPSILIEEGDCPVDFTKSSHERVRRSLELEVVIVTGVDQEVDQRSGSEIINSIMADVESAIGQHERWDGLAIMTEPPDYTTRDVDQETPQLHRGLRYLIHFEHLRGNPWAQ